MSWIVSLGNNHNPSIPEDTVNLQSQIGTFDISFFTKEKNNTLNLEETVTQFVKKSYGDWPLNFNEVTINSISGIEGYYIQEKQIDSSNITVLKLIFRVLEKNQRVFFITTQIVLDETSKIPVAGENGQERLKTFNQILSTFKFTTSQNSCQEDNDCPINYFCNAGVSCSGPPLEGQEIECEEIGSKQCVKICKENQDCSPGETCQKFSITGGDAIEIKYGCK